MQICKNNTKIVSIYWPTYMLVEVAPEVFEYKLVGFGQKVAITPKAQMRANVVCCIRSVSYYRQIWLNRFRTCIENQPELAIIDSDELESIIKHVDKTRAFEKFTPEQCFAETFKNILAE